MLGFFAQGFMLGLAYLAPIGMQNLYVINTAIRRERKRAYQVAFITSFFDITLALACFFGMGILMEKSELLKMIILGIGCIAVIYIGIGLIRSKPGSEGDMDVNKSLGQVVIACFSVTWLNPQAVIDGSLLLGGFRASLTPGMSNVFITGACTASLLWFTGIATIASIFKNSFSSKIIRAINIICGVIIVYYGLKLGFDFIIGLL